MNAPQPNPYEPPKTETSTRTFVGKIVLHVIGWILGIAGFGLCFWYAVLGSFGLGYPNYSGLAFIVLIAFVPTFLGAWYAVHKWLTNHFRSKTFKASVLASFLWTVGIFFASEIAFTTICSLVVGPI